ncbi:MAG: hypothetical protein L0G25_03800 [Psychrobacter sp.]|nr:hypothetical protein [Psychrobacter sp.]
MSFELDDKHHGSSLSVTLNENADKQKLADIYLGSDSVATTCISHCHNQSFNPTCVHGPKDFVSVYLFKLYVAKALITGLEDFDPDDHYSEARCDG